MNVNSTQNVTATNSQQSQVATPTETTTEGTTSFQQELSELEQSQKIQEEEYSSVETPKEPEENNILSNAVDGLESTVLEVNNSKIPQAEDKSELELKLQQLFVDNINNTEDTHKTEIHKTTVENLEVNTLINNEINLPDGLIPHMETNMSFNSNGQPFSEFMNEQEKNKLSVTEKDLQEEKAILSSMEENIAMVNKAQIAAAQNSVQKTEVAIIEPFDNIIMNKADVDFFVDLVNNNEIDMSTVKNPEKVTQISKTLADLLAKAMNENKPVRIDFDNDISVIIRISKDGKISADFLPSSQIAETYLKENLPLLKQRFDENNIEYDELNQRKQQKQNEKDNRKKGRENE